MGLGWAAEVRFVSSPEFTRSHPGIDRRFAASEFDDLRIGFKDGLQLEFDAQRFIISTQRGNLPPQRTDLAGGTFRLRTNGRIAPAERVHDHTMAHPFGVQLFGKEQGLVQRVSRPDPLRCPVLTPGQQAGQCGTAHQGRQTEAAGRQVAEQQCEAGPAADHPEHRP